MSRSRKRANSLPEWFDITKYEACDRFTGEDWYCALMQRRKFYFSSDSDLDFRTANKQELLDAQELFIAMIADEPLKPDLSEVRFRFGLLKLKSSLKVIGEVNESAAEGQFLQRVFKEFQTGNEATAEGHQLIQRITEIVELLVSDVDDAMDTFARAPKGDDSKRIFLLLRKYCMEAFKPYAHNNGGASPLVSEASSNDVIVLAGVAKTLGVEQGPLPLLDAISSVTEDHPQLPDHLGITKSNIESAKQRIPLMISLDATDSAIETDFRSLLENLRHKYEKSEPLRKPTPKNVEKLADYKILAVLDVTMWWAWENLQFSYDVLNQELFDFQETPRTLQDKIVSFSKECLSDGFLESLGTAP